VARAFVVFLTLILVYVAIIGAKIARIERELSELVKDDK
jgi:CcmD family protein